MSTKFFLLTAVMTLILAFGVMAQEKGVHKTFTGTLNCTGCDLKKADGANAQCKVYGHSHSLKLKNGEYISFLENDLSAELIKGGDWHGKEVEVHGVFYDGAKILDVESFETGDKSYSWCKGHTAMDQCHSGHQHGMKKGK